MGAMQFGIFSVGDITPDPTTGQTPTEHERIMATVAIAEKAEEVGLDVFATGEHHNPPFVCSSPTTLLGFLAARTNRLVFSTSTTLITTNDPVKIAEDFNTFPGRTFRCVVEEVASIEANLSIANMDFHEFADNVEADGVFRGFPEE